MKKTTSKSSIFLMELILSIFFFSLASGVCIQLFVKAHTLGISTAEINNATLWSQNIAESFYASSDTEEFATLLPFQAFNENTYALFFDKNWEPLTAEDILEINDPSSFEQVLQDSKTYQQPIYYCARVVLSEDSSFRYATISILDSETYQTSLYEITIKSYLPIRSIEIHE